MIKKILLVEDEEEVLNILQSRLVQAGFEVQATSRGQEALRMAIAFLPDLVLTDIVLPDIDGPEIVRLLKSDGRTSSARILFFSGILGGNETNESPEVVIGGRQYMAIAKPFNFKQLLEKIEQMA